MILPSQQPRGPVFRGSYDSINISNKPSHGEPPDLDLLTWDPNSSDETKGRTPKNPRSPCDAVNPPGKLTWQAGKSPCSMGNTSSTGAFFHCYVSLPDSSDKLHPSSFFKYTLALLSRWFSLFPRWHMLALWRVSLLIIPVLATSWNQAIGNISCKLLSPSSHWILEGIPRIYQVPKSLLAPRMAARSKNRWLQWYTPKFRFD